MGPFTGKFEMIDPRLIVVDHRYQRPEKEALILDIAQGFSWPSFGTVTCFKRNNTYYAVDGQQRLQAALSQNPVPKEVPCIVFPETDLKMEAKTFVDMQVNRKAVTGLEKHRAELVAEHPPALAIERAANKVGFSITRDTHGPQSIRSIKTLHWIYEQLGEEGVVQVLVQLRDAWPDNIDATGVNIIKGVGNLIVEQGDKYDRQKMTAALKRSHPERIEQQARAFQFDKGGSKEVNIRRAFKQLCKI